MDCIEETEETKELFVVKKGDKWCVVHGHPKKPGSKTDKPEGSIIKCFPGTPEGKKQAEAMHKAIIISKIKRGEMNQLDKDADISGNYSINLLNIEDKPIIVLNKLI